MISDERRFLVTGFDEKESELELKRRFAKTEKETRPEEVTREQVIAYLATLAKPASIREIAHGMGLKHAGRRFLPRVIGQLKRKNEIEEVHNGRYLLAGVKRGSAEAERGVGGGAGVTTAAASGGRADAGAATRDEIATKRAADPNLVSGRVVAHRDGYGFVVPDAPMRGVEGDLYIGRDNMGDAMNGDRVLARIERRRFDGRAEGRVVRIIEREHATLVGLFRYGPHGNSVLPYDTRILHEVVIPPGEELTPDLRQKSGADASGAPAANRRTRLPELDGAVVNVELTRLP